MLKNMESLRWLVSRNFDTVSFPGTNFTSIDLGGLYEERQFIIVPGGANVTVSNMTTTEGTIDTFWWECNKGTKVHVFDTYDWEFKPEFDPDNKGSGVPPLIVKLVGGSNIGGATLNQPKAGWDTIALGPLFSTRNQLPPDLKITHPTSLGSENSKKGPIIGGSI